MTENKLRVDDIVKLDDRGIKRIYRIVAVNRQEGTIEIVSPAYKKKTVNIDAVELIKKHVTKQEKIDAEERDAIMDVNLDDEEDELTDEENAKLAEEEDEDEEDELSDEENAKLAEEDETDVDSDKLKNLDF